VITLKVPNVLDKEALQHLLDVLDKGELPLIMEPEGEMTEDDLIGQVTQVADLGVDFEVMVQLAVPHRFVASAAFVFAAHPNGSVYLVQKETWVPKAS